MSPAHALERPRSSTPPVRPALRVGRVDDPAEAEADAVADSVMSMPEPTTQADGASPTQGDMAPVLRRACGCGACAGADEIRRQPEEEEEEPIQLKPARPAAGGVHVGADTAQRIEAKRGTGAGLAPEVRAFFEPRFGTDLSAVRLHRDAESETLASSVGARAFTVGRDVFLGSGEGSFASRRGKHLLAHELTHTLQNRTSDTRTVRRLVHPTRSNCPAGVHGAPADPIAALTALDADAQRMALGASGVLFVEALTRNDATFGPSNVSTAFVRRFGPPIALSNGKFRTRFTGNQNFDTAGEAISGGMLGLARRFDRIAAFFGRNVDYDCPGTALKTIGGCRDRCIPNRGAWVCVGGPRNVAICEPFWTTASAAQQAGMLVHEAVHILFNHADHASGNQAQRRRNPECYTSFLADIYTFPVWDVRCPA